MKPYFYYLLFFLSLNASIAFTQKDDYSIYTSKQQLQTASTDSEKLEILHNLSQALLYADALQSMQVAEKMFVLSKNSNDKKSEVQALIHISKSAFLLNNQLRAEESANTALQISQENNFLEKEAQALIALAQTSFVQNPQIAEENLEKAIQISKDNKLPLSEAEAYRVLGLIKQSNNQIENAENYLEQSIQLYKSQGNLSETARTLEFLGDMKENVLEAKQIYSEALDWAVKADDKRLIMSLLNRSGEIQSNPQEGLKYYFQGFIVGQEYDFLQNGKKLANSLNGIRKSYKTLADETKNPKRKKEYESLEKSYEELLDFLKNNNYNVEKFRQKLTEEKVNQKNILPNKNRSAQEQIQILKLQKQRLLIDNQEKNNLISILEAAEARAKLRNEEDSLRLLQKDREIEALKEQQKNQDKSIENLKTSNQEKDAKIKGRQKGSWLWWLLLILGILLLLLLLLWLRRRYSKKIKNTENTSQGLKEQVRNQQVLISNKEVQVKELGEENELLTEILDNEVRPPLEEIVADSSSNVHRLVIHQSGKQMLNLVNNVLDIYKLQGVNINLYQQTNSLYKITLEAFSQVSELIKRRNIRIDNQIDPFIYVSCDREITKRIFLNLIQNTLKYSSTGTSIKMNTSVLTEEQVEVIYSDDAKEIPRQYLSKVFDKIPPREARPSGLGMLFAKIVIEAHKGKIQVDSENQQTYFKFMLPVVKDVPEEQLENLEIHQINFNFSEEEIQFLKPYAIQLKKHEVYETTMVKNVLDQINTEMSENIGKWKKMLEETVFFLEENKYQQLVKKITDE